MGVFRKSIIDKKLNWIAPTLINGWSSFGMGYDPMYAKDVYGNVFFQGLVKGGSNNITTPIFNLPFGMNPRNFIINSARTSGGSGGIEISNGIVYFLGIQAHTGNANIWLSIYMTFKGEI